MVRIGAMRFKSAIQTVMSTTPSVKMVPTLGLSSSPVPLPVHFKKGGRILSFANACKTLGAPNILPIALDKVAPQTPMRILSPQNDIFLIINGSLIKASTGALFANIKGKIM